LLLCCDCCDVDVVDVVIVVVVVVLSLAVFVVVVALEENLATDFLCMRSLFVLKQMKNSAASIVVILVLAAGFLATNLLNPGFTLGRSPPAVVRKSGLAALPPQTAPSFQALPSGWDAAGLYLFRNTTDKLYNGFLNSPDNVDTYQTWPLGPVREHNVTGVAGAHWMKDYLDGFPKWERRNFLVFLKYVPGHSVYVDFGSWIGPTLFFGSQLVGETLICKSKRASWVQSRRTESTNTKTKGKC
jgi:hypothetical protein